MKKSVLALAALAAVGFSGAAFAEDATTGTWSTVTGPAAMTDSEMDKVTAGAEPLVKGMGVETAASASGKEFNSPRWYPNKGHGTANIHGNPHLIAPE